MSNAGRAHNEDGTTYRGVMKYENPSTGEVIYQYTPTYAQPGHAKGMITRKKRKFFYAENQWDSATKGYVQRGYADRFPLVDTWVEKAIQWVRI